MAGAANIRDVTYGVDQQAIWFPPVALFDLIREMGVRVTDWSPVMQPASEWMRRDTLEVFAAGGPGDWAPMSEATRRRWGDHPLLMRKLLLYNSIVRVWSRTNAAVVTRAPHAHLSEGGTARHYTSGGTRLMLYNDKRGGRASRRTAAQVQKAAAKIDHSVVHEPARVAFYVDEFTAEKICDAVLDYYVKATEA